MSSTQTLLRTGQYRARTYWETHASGAAFDRKKTSYLTEDAQEFIAEQAMCVISGLTLHNELDGMLVMGEPGFVQMLDESTCLFSLESRGRGSYILQNLRYALSNEQEAWLSLFFICHPSRERLCVHGTVEMLTPTEGQFSSSSYSSPVVVRLHVREAFFHCSKYIRTRIAGLTIPEPTSGQGESLLDALKPEQSALSEEHCAFLSQQIVCFLCTVNQDGRCAVNHRGGAAGFLVPHLPSQTAPGGIVLLPDFAGNGAFEAIGNILETGKVALVIPDYVHQFALRIAGAACVVKPEDLRKEVAQRCNGAERIIALAVQHIEMQSEDWSATLAYETARAAAFRANNPAAPISTFS